MWRRLLCVALLLLAGNAWAGAEVLVEKAWLRETVPGQTSVSLQLKLTVTRPARLVGVSSSWAAAVEMHKLTLNRGKMKARVVQSLSLARNRTLAFGNRNIALMMVGIKQPLKEGEHVPVSLMLEFGKRRSIVELEAEVRPLELSYKHYGGQEVYDHE